MGLGLIELSQLLTGGTQKTTKDLKPYSRSVALGVFLGYYLVHRNNSRFLVVLK
jgi:hypothetical protein